MTEMKQQCEIATSSDSRDFGINRKKLSNVHLNYYQLIVLNHIGNNACFVMLRPRLVGFLHKHVIFFHEKSVYKDFSVYKDLPTAIWLLKSCMQEQQQQQPLRLFMLPTVLRRWSWYNSYFVWFCGLCYEAFHVKSYLAPCSNKIMLLLFFFSVLVSICLMCICLFILYALHFCLFLFFLVSGVDCGLWPWHSLNFSFNFLHVLFYSWRQHLIPFLFCVEGRLSSSLPFEPPRDKTNKMACAPSKDCVQPGNPLRKLSLQTCLCSHPVGLDLWFLVVLFVYFHTLCKRTEKALVRLFECTGSPEPSPVACDNYHTLMSWLKSNLNKTIKTVLKNTTRTKLVLKKKTETENSDEPVHERRLTLVH